MTTGQIIVEGMPVSSWEPNEFWIESDDGKCQDLIDLLGQFRGKIRVVITAIPEESEEAN